MTAVAAPPFVIDRSAVGRLRVAVAPVPGLRSVSALLALEAGQWYEPSRRAGIARLTAQSLLRGTTRRDAPAWASAIDDLGAVARMDVGAHVAILSGQCLATDLEGYLGLVAEAVLHPALVPDQVELVRAETLAAIEETSRNTRSVADRIWRQLAYPAGHPFHTPALGDEDVVRSATVDELAGYHQAGMLGRGGVLVLAGGISADDGIAAAESAFGPWPGGPASPDREVPTVSIASVQRRADVVPDKTQSDVVIGWLGLPRADPRFVAARVANMLFAADTFASRAGKVVRDELGLAYYVFATIAATKGQGAWVVRMGVNPQNVERAIETALRELRVVLAGDFPEQDLELAKDKMMGELRVALESPGGIAQMVLEQELFDLGLDHYERYAEQIRAITKDQAVDVARQFLSADRYALAIAGPPLAS